jgi:hypothetical protein
MLNVKCAIDKAEKNINILKTVKTSRKQKRSTRCSNVRSVHTNINVVPRDSLDNYSSSKNII